MENQTLKTQIVVIGSGPGGYVAAIRLAQLGKEVIVIEKEKDLGGICLNHGCIPTKALIHSTDFFTKIEELKLMGINIKDYEFDLSKMKDWKNNVVKKLNMGINHLFKHQNIKLINGVAKFKNSNEIEIQNNNEIKKIIFEKAIIATGSNPREIKGFEFDNKIIIDSNEILKLNYIPKKLAIIGGGYIGTEIGTIFSKLGSDVHIIDHGRRLLNAIDEDIVNVVIKKINELGVKIYCEAKTEIISKKENSILIKINEKEIEVDKLLIAVGRKPNSNNLGLENTKVKIDNWNNIVVDEYYKTNDENIYAIGDVIGHPMLAHKASHEAKIVSENMCGIKNNNAKVIPSAVFTDPEIASVGLSEKQCIEKKLDYAIGKFNYSNLGRALTLNQKEGFMKIISNKKNNKILGVHCVGYNASDLIAEATLAIENELNVEDIVKTIHTHPTMSEIIMEAAEDVLGKSVHKI
jgi:dihydrolipoamide dehydrogenase